MSQYDDHDTNQILIFVLFRRLLWWLKVKRVSWWLAGWHAFFLLLSCLLIFLTSPRRSYLFVHSFSVFIIIACHTWPRSYHAPESSWWQRIPAITTCTKIDLLVLLLAWWDWSSTLCSDRTFPIPSWSEGALIITLIVLRFDVILVLMKSPHHYKRRTPTS